MPEAERADDAEEPSLGRRPLEGMTVTLSFEFACAWLVSRCRTDRGAALVEYALLVALIALICVAAVTFLGVKLSSKFSGIGSGVAG